MCKNGSKDKLIAEVDKELRYVYEHIVGASLDSKENEGLSITSKVLKDFKDLKERKKAENKKMSSAFI